MIPIKHQDGRTGFAWQRTAPTTLREMLVDRLVPVGCDVGDYLIAFDNGTWAASRAVDFAQVYTVTGPAVIPDQGAVLT